MSHYKGPTPREWQKEAIAHWSQYSKGIIQAVPGSGKTILAIETFCQKLDENPNVRVLIVCPRLTLIKQWTNEILENTTLKEKDIYEISSKNEVAAFKKAQEKFSQYKVFISTFNQIKQFFSQEGWKNHEWFLIVDEMHNTTEGYNFPDAPIKYKLGLSATPKKKGKTSTFNLGGIIYTYSFEQALNDKIILEPEFKLILYSIDKQLFEKILEAENNAELTDALMDKAYKSFMHDSKKEYTKEDIKKLCEIDPKDGGVNEELIKIDKQQLNKKAGEEDFFTSKNVDFLGIQKILSEKFNIGSESKDKKALQTLVFVNRIKKADLLNEMLLANFKKPISHSYHSQCLEYNYKGHFESISKQFEENKFNVLISVSTLGEGIDFPYASCGILASPVHNPTAFVQKVGRLLRKYKDQEKAVIYYYVPSELITRLLSDPKISPNYLKSVLKIADEHKNLYFVDRQTLHEKRGSLADLLSQGAAYERNEDIEKLKIPTKLDSILRCFRRVYPKSFKHWKKFCTEEGDFSELESKIIEKSKTSLFIAENLERNLTKVHKLQEIMVKEEGYDKVKMLVEEAIRLGVVTKIKYGLEIENYYLEKSSKLDPAEQKMLITALKSEYANFRKQSTQTKKELEKIHSLIPVLKKQSSSKQKKLDAMYALSKIFFSLQSIFLDQLELEVIAKLADDERFVLTIGKDLFVASAEIKSYAYPEEFGYSRWQDAPKRKEVPIVPAIEQFCVAFLKEHPEEVLPKEKAQELIKKINQETKTNFSKDEIKKEIEKGKFSGKYSLSKAFFAIETIEKM
ncbi:MAG TPA: DEAD/DEAH box helicase family protein [archaeon]|nr:DEAD/DEAH box helicase family protein [archaeon]